MGKLGETEGCGSKMPITAKHVTKFERVQRRPTMTHITLPHSYSQLGSTLTQNFLEELNTCCTNTNYTMSRTHILVHLHNKIIHIICKDNKKNFMIYVS